MAGYTRQSVADIIANAIIKAEDERIVEKKINLKFFLLSNFERVILSKIYEIPSIIRMNKIIFIRIILYNSHNY